MTLGQVPILWGSKLQTKIATSTQHAEYVSLSNSMRELLPVQGLLQELTGKFDIDRDEVAKVTKVYEDNQGCLNLAKSPLAKTTPQSKFYAVKYLWFREQLDNLRVKLLPITSALQLADI